MYRIYVTIDEVLEILNGFDFKLQKKIATSSGLWLINSLFGTMEDGKGVIDFMEKDEHINFVRRDS